MNRVSLNSGWRFYRGLLDWYMELPEEGTREVTLPHDWSIEDFAPLAKPFHAHFSDGGAGTGYAIGGMGVYERKLAIEEEGTYEFNFDGVYGISNFFLDGKAVATNTYGYVPIVFRAELTKGEHVLKVRVRNVGTNSRWYSGSGIYRSATMSNLSAVQLEQFGLFVRTLDVSETKATVVVQLEAATTGDVTVRITSPSGAAIGEAKCSLQIGVNTVSLDIDRPELWFPCDLGLQPLYRCEVEAGGSILESTAFGIRSIELDAQNGLRFNGVRTRLKGGCLHHDHGILGAAAFADAEERRLRKLRDAGFNAIRTSHNPPSTAFLDACNRLGIVVMDEAFDEWEREKSSDSYHRFFAAQSDEDLALMVRRDRNHPSVALWSIGNEIPGSFSRPDIASRLRKTALQHDPSRLITEGMCKPWWVEEDWKDWALSSDPGFEFLDVAGINYLWDEANSDHSRNPDRTMMHTESYPSDAAECWDQMVNTTYVVGDFVWTCWDYIGESGLGRTYLTSENEGSGSFPFHLAICGDFDLIGERKPQSYYREAQWRPGVLAMATSPEPSVRGLVKNTAWHEKWGWEPVEMHWTWPGFEGKPTIVEVYSSSDSVELFLNGLSVGVATPVKHRAKFEIAYAPGELRVVGSDGQQFTLQTAGEPAQVTLLTEPGTEELLFVQIELVDAQGIRVPNADRTIKLNLTGPATLQAFGNANPTDVSSVQDFEHRTHQGRALAILRRTGEGEISLQAQVEGPTPASLEI